MKHSIIFRTSVLAIAFLAAISCTKETPSSGSGSADADRYVTFSATLGADATRTHLDGVQVKWDASDTIRVFYGKVDSAFASCSYFIKSIDATDGRIATFNGLALASREYLAVYPEYAAADCSKKGKLTVEIPRRQTLTSGSFAQKANVAVAYSSGAPELSFSNVGGLLAFRLTSAGGHVISKVRLTGTDAMSGTVEIKLADLPKVSEVTEGINYVELKDEDGTISEGSTYYFVSLPGSHTGFVMTFEDADGRTAVLRSGAPFTVERGSNTFIADVALEDSDFRKDGKLVINEIHTHNNLIELWNPGDKDVDISGYYFTKDDSRYWGIPVGTVIPANGYKVFAAGQTDCSQGPTFGISGDKGFELKLSNGKKVDKVDNSGEGHAVIGPDETYGRRTDGADQWVTFIDNGTIYEDGVCDGDNSKGTVKQDEPIPVIDYTGLVINELNGNDKFIELYNGSANEMSLWGCTIRKDSGDVVWTGAKSVTIAAGGYVLLYSEDVAAPEYDPNLIFHSGLSPKKAVRIELLTPKGESIDDFNYATYSGTPAPASYGRNADQDWYYQAATPGTVNTDGTDKVTGLK